MVLKLNDHINLYAFPMGLFTFCENWMVAKARSMASVMSKMPTEGGKSYNALYFDLAQ